MSLVSVIVPVYFNAESLAPLVQGLQKATASLKGYSFEFIFVDDGSQDRSFETLLQLRKRESRIKILKLSRNFGSHCAILAGFSRSNGVCHMILGADLQDPPEIIGEFLRKWREGYKIVVGIRKERHDPWMTEQLANLYYLAMRYTFRNMPRKGFDIFLLDECVRHFLLQIGTRNLSLVASILWTGYAVGEVPYVRGERPFGRSRWSLLRRIKLAIDSLTAFSYLPVLLMFSMGLLLTLLSGVLWKVPPAGGGASRDACFFLGTGLSFLGLGVLAEYLWRILEASRGFPDFVVEWEVGFKGERGVRKNVRKIP